MKHYDAVIIGFGKGGKTLAGSLAGMGKKVAMIEKSDKMYGGTCINVGCIPTKSLVNSAKASVIQKPGSYDEKNRLYWEAVEEKRRLTGMLRKKNFDKLNDLDNVTVYNGLGSFVSANRVKIETAEETFEVEGDQIFINTGSVSVIPPIKGIEGNPYVYTSDSLMELDVLPKRLAIIGGGYIGLEYASMYTDFGAEVTVYQIEDKLIPREDRDIAEAIQKAFEDKGVRFEMNVQTEEIENAGDEAVVHYKKDGTALSASADAVLIATGRKPNTDGLNLEAAGVEKTPRGAVKVDEKLRTSAPNIWAMGDVAGGLQFTYVSLDDFRIVKDQLAGSGKRASNDRTVPYSVFIDPPFSRVGLNEEEAAAQGYHVKISKLPAAAIPKAQVLRKPVGLLKAVIDADTNKILGAMLFCEESYEMINIVKLAMDAGLDYTVLRDQIFTHPTMSEALNDLFAV
ncbi:pyridine nucleotide-disulfide oxidoreductase [Eubacterium sp. AM05-23]|uniref:FAD-dependent oxidoreductase n=1 Tax=Eubacterium TaxID=1730 RepID=UPI000E467E91|nr:MULTISPECIES: FAD-dependent oxidoreductase [Eubacterium]RHO55628.1 pyridine nucleotide-disulfide oxidoreductase [Eubacterium sp. AM05-23]